jgi:membrane protease YdiL (CAAX protease family)
VTQPLVRAGSFDPSRGVRIFLGLGLGFGLFHWVAGRLGSDRGQLGLAVGAIVVVAMLLVERAFFGLSLAQAAKALGIGRPNGRGVGVAIGIGAALLVVIPIYGLATGTRLSMYPGWSLLLPGLFAQGGIAEETLFRGFLFRRVREGRSFWRAVAIAAVPFVAVHLILFATLPFPVAVASILLAAIISAPLAHLFELGGRTVWAPAIVHFVVQGAIKVVTPPEGELGLALVWMAASAVLPFLAFLVPRPDSEP